MNHFDLKGRRAVVTGAAQGFGRAITERLLASGASVALWDLDETETTRTAGELKGRGTVFTQTVDVSDMAQVDAATAATVKAFGGIDILVANAGIAGPNHKTWEYPPDEWQRVIEVDLMSVFYCCRAVIPEMLKGKYGRIVTISSVAGKEGNANASAYSAAKAGVIALDEIARQGARRREHRRELHHAGGCQDPHLRADVAVPPRLDAVEDPARPLPADRRARLAGGVAGIGREFLLHWRGLRHQWGKVDILRRSVNYQLPTSNSQGKSLEPRGESHANELARSDFHHVVRPTSRWELGFGILGVES